jgi:hypothetical protein
MRLFLEVQRTLGVKDRTAYEFGGARERNMSYRKLEKDTEGKGRSRGEGGYF